MAKDRYDRQIVMLVTEVTNEGYNKWYHVQVSLATVEDSKSAFSTREVRGHYVENLEVSCQGDNEREKGVYEWTYGFTGQSFVTIGRAEEMLETLRFLGKAIAKAIARDGDTTSYGQFVLRIARAFGIDDIWFQSARWEGYQKLNALEGSRLIDSLIESWQADGLTRMQRMDKQRSQPQDVAF